LSRKVAEDSEELSGGHGNGTISLNNRSDVELAKVAKQLKRKGGTYRGIGQKLGISKSRAWRIINKDIDRTNISEEDLDDSLGEIEEAPALPFEPVEFLSDNELKKTSRRLKMELAVKRMRARSKWLDYISNNPGQYQNQQGFDGHDREERRSSAEKRSDAFIEKILLTKIIAGGNQKDSMGPKELLSFASNLKSLFSSDAKADDFWEKMTRFKNLEEGVIKERQEIQDRANRIANSRVDKSLKQKAIEKGLEFAEKIPEIIASATRGGKGGNPGGPPPPQATESTETLTISPEDAHLPLENPENQSGGFGDGGPRMKPNSRKKKPTPAKEIVSNLAEVKET